MSTLNLNLKFRPIRIGWCIHDGNMDELEDALRLTWIFWGGKYNPIIPIEDKEYAKDLIDKYRVDVLYPVHKDKELIEFCQSFKYLPWPLFVKDLFPGKIKPTFIDVNVPIVQLKEQYRANALEGILKIHIPRWEDDDPLKYFFLTTFGGYPKNNEVNINYADFVIKYLKGNFLNIQSSEIVNTILLDNFTPANISSFNLSHLRYNIPFYHGFYIGNSQYFNDIVYYWNLRAAAIDVIFYDVCQSKRLEPLKGLLVDKFERLISESPINIKYLTLFSSLNTKENNLITSKIEIARQSIGKIFWKSSNIIPTFVYFDNKSVISSVDETQDKPSVVFQIPEIQISKNEYSTDQHFAVTTKPLVDISFSDEFTFLTPFLPELNEYYGREYDFIWNASRAEREGLGIIINSQRNNLNIRALKVIDLIEKVMNIFKMKIKPSDSGIVTKRLINQMGGLQKCRVLKILGLRNLIKKYSPHQCFNKSSALQIIGKVNHETNNPSFDNYKDIVLDSESKRQLNPIEVFTYLLRKEVFRVGLKLHCPNCNLEYWQTIDDIKTKAKCEYCGREFNILPQLKDRDWFYRRSGIFGRDDNQRGGIPVALTLQQLDTLLSFNNFIYYPGIEIEFMDEKNKNCEIDFILITNLYRQPIQIAIGECKTNGIIDDGDIKNVTKISEFINNKVDLFIIFAKTSPFNSDEIERCKKLILSPCGPKVILLSDRELETWYIYEQTAKLFNISEYVTSLDDLARNTIDIYFDPKRK